MATTLLLCLLHSLAALLPWAADPPASATIVVAGDAMQHQAQIDAAKRSDGTYDYSACFAEVAPYIKAADYAIVNLETPLGGRPYSGYPCFCSPDEYLAALADAGFDMMLTANNHTLDRRDSGLTRTLDQLDHAGVDHIGTYRSLAERNSVLPMVRRVAGFDIGFLNYTYGTNGIALRSAAIVDYIDRRQMAADIALTRQAGAEIVVVCVHWGDEYRLHPNASQRSLADFLVEQGADVVVGGHPHVVQPMEMRTDTAGRQALVVYSLGNFISAMRTRDTRGGAAVRISISRNASGQAIVAAADYRLLFTVPPTADNPQFRLIPVEAADEQGAALPQQWRNACRDFTASAEALFNANNRGVPRDSSSLIPPVAPLPSLLPDKLKTYFTTSARQLPPPNLLPLLPPACGKK